MRELVIAGLVTAGLTGCSEVQFEKSKVQAVVSGTEVVEAQTACANAQGPMQEQAYSVSFDNPRNEVPMNQIVCPFGQNDNVGVANGYMTARYTQEQELTLPANAVVCDVQFLFTTQAMKYDDNFFFTFNDYIVATNDDYWQKKFMTKAKLPIGSQQSLDIIRLDWSSIVGQPNSNKAMSAPGTDYCLGAAEGLSACTWPQTQVAGNISMSVSNRIVTALGLTAKNQKIRLGFVTTGDDDQAIDCQHEPLSFSMKVKYVLK